MKILQPCNAQTAPIALRAAMASNSGFEAVWQPVAGITIYQIDVSTDSTFAQKTTFIANSNEIPPDQDYFGPNNHLSTRNGNIWYTIPQLSSSTKYYYRVRSESNGFTSASSNVIKVTTEANPPQVAPLKWLKTIYNPGEVAEVQSMIGDDDGNIYAAGRFSKTIVAGATTLVSNGDDDMFIMKMNSDGNILWAKSVGGSMGDGEASLAVDSSGLYIVGIFRSTVDVDPGPGVMTFTNAGIDPADGFYMKLKPDDGTLLWAHQLIDALPWSPACIALDATGVYIGGYFFGSSNLGTSNSQFTSQGHNDVFFGKYNLTNGNTIWAKSLGGPNYDGIRAIDVDNGGMYIIGFFNGDGDWNTGTINGTVDFDPGSGVTNLSAGGGFVARYSTSDGSLVFAKAFSGTSNYMCNPYGIDVNHSSIYLSGNFHGTINFDPSPGNQKTAEDIGAFIGKFDALNGNAIWVKDLITAHFIHPRKVIADNAGVYVSGAFGQSVNFDPAGSASGIRTALLGYDNYMARYTPGGTFEWVKTLYVVSIAPAARTSDGYFLGGMFWNPVNFDPYLGNGTVIPNGNGLFVAKYQAVSPPFVPKAVTASAVDTTSFTATWKPMPGASGYSFDVSSDNFNSFVPGYHELPVTSDTKKITGLAPGKTYYLRIRSVNSYGSSDNSSALIVNTVCAEKPTIKLDLTNELAPTLISSAAKGNQWFLNGQAILNATSQTLVVTMAGSYTVQVTSGACKSEMSEAQVVILTGITTPAHETFVNVFPNPAREIVFLQLENLNVNQPTTVEILDSIGRKLTSLQSAGKAIITIDLSNYNASLFIIRGSQSGKHFEVKVVKQ